MREKIMCSPSSHALVLASAKASATGPNVSPPMYVIRHSGAFYRPNAQGYTYSLAEAWRLPKEEAEKYVNTDPQHAVTIQAVAEIADQIDCELEVAVAKVNALRNFKAMVQPDSVSGRHSQSEDTNVAECEACQSGPEGVTPNSLQEGALEDLIKKLDAFADRKRGPVGRAMQIEPRFSCGDLTFGDILDTVAVLRTLSTDLAKAKEERDEALAANERLSRLGRAIERERNEALARAEAAEKERDEANRVLGLAVEQAARSAERTMEAIARSEALQAENEDLDRRATEYALGMNNQALQLATLTKRIEEYEREFRSIAALPTQREILLNDLTIDEDAHSYSAIVLRVRALLNTKGESDV